MTEYASPRIILDQFKKFVEAATKFHNAVRENEKCWNELSDEWKVLDSEIDYAHEVIENAGGNDDE